MLRRFLIPAVVMCSMLILSDLALATDEVTFIFLADPQISRAGGRSDTDQRLLALSDLNDALNNIESEKWPDIFDSELPNPLPTPFTCRGEEIGPVHGIFFGGDLNETGGDYDSADQTFRIPPKYKGGWELQAVRLLFEQGFTELDWWGTLFASHINWPESKFTKTKYDRVYFGLGNHDVQTSDHPIVGWWMGCIGPNLSEIHLWTDKVDYWRYQTWNFISQMHAGPYYVREFKLGSEDIISEYWTYPSFPVVSIDAPAPGGYSHDCFDWKHYSFNYRVNLPPYPATPLVSVFQLHNYGGDTNFGRDSGLEWLKDELKAISLNDKDRPIIIIQHFPFSWEDEFGVWWTKAHKDALLAILEPYNVVAFLTGHTHSRNSFPAKVTISGSSKSFQDFTVGVSNAGRFALVRVTDTTFDIAHAYLDSGSIVWDAGYSMPRADADGPYTGDEGSAITFDGSGSDGTIDKYEWDLDDDGAFETEGPTVSETWSDDYNGMVTLRVSNDKGGVDIASTTVTVNNVSPTVYAGTDKTINEGDTFTSSGSFTDPGADTWTVKVDYGDGSGAQPLAHSGKTFSLSHAYGDNGTYTVTVTVEDDDGGMGSDTLEVTVNNVAPMVTIDSVTSPVEGCILPGQELSFAGSFADPGWLDIHTALWSFGDGNTDTGTLTEENEEPDATGTVSAKHTYSEPGTFNVVLTVQDDEGGIGTAKKDVKVMTASEAVDFTISFIQDLPDSCFDKKPEQQKNAFSEKLEAVKNAIAAGGLEGAINKLQNDIRTKFDGSVDGNSRNKDDWITCQDSQRDLCLMVDELVKYLESQQEKKKAEVAQGGGKDGEEEQPEIAEDDSKGKDAVEAAPALLGKFDFAALTAYPQPCNPEVWIPYTLGERVKVSITIHDVNGRAVRILDLGYQNPGAYITRDKAAHWDGKDKAGEDVASGIYFYTITAGDFSATRKMVVKR